MARVGSYDADDIEELAGDLVPNLMLIERLQAEVAPALAALESTTSADQLARFRRAQADVDRILAPLLSLLTEERRGAVESLIAAGRAPSPFCAVARD